MLYRCGWCGTRCDADGVVLTEWIHSDEDYKKAKPVEGECCIEEQQRQQFVDQEYVTHDMDAQDPSLEGQPL